METASEVVTVGGGCRTADAFAANVLNGLSRTPKSLSSKYFYDEAGSRLFQQITETEEYYLTRCEFEILKTSCRAIARPFQHVPFRLIELGVGDGRKTAVLLDHFLDQGLDFHYVPIDICRESVCELAESLGRRYATKPLEVCGVVADYVDGLRWLRRQNPLRNLVIFLGSSIGNFTRRQTHRFLHRLRRSLSPGDHLLIGFDLKKNPQLLHRAYNDAAGLTRRFNLNLLQRINREFDGDFELSRFYHHGYYNARRGRMESWLVSKSDQVVHIQRLKRAFPLHAWEAIHVENSYKYDLAEINSAASQAGFLVDRHLLDSRRYFVDSLWRAV